MIPKKIHYCWFGKNPKPALAEKCIKSWKKYCPDYEIIEWNEDNYDYLKNDFMREAYEAKKWGFVPDYARLDIIYSYGGIYLDTDVEIIKPIDHLLGFKGFMGFQSMNSIALGLGFGAEAGNDFIKALLDSYKEKHFRNPDGTLNLIASPESDSMVVGRLGIKMNNEFQKKDGFAFLPMEYLSPLSVDTGEKHITKSTVSIHWFAGSWLSEEQLRQKKLDYRQHRREVGRGKRHMLVRKVLGDQLYEQLKKKAGRA